MLMAYEHHMKIDLTGYPAEQAPARTRRSSRASWLVADGFDAGTSMRSYQYEPWPPDEVLRRCGTTRAAASTRSW